jgi:hypothetical protein
MHSDLLTAMYTKFVRRLRCRTLWVCFVLSLLCCVRVAEQGAGATQSQQLYLLAGTTTQHSDDSYPVLLYRVGKNKKLELAREVVPQSDGIRFVYAWEDAIFALHPHNSATKACIVHTNEPMRADDVTIGHQNATLASTATTIAAPPGSALVLLAPWITNLTAPTPPPAQFNVTVARISSGSAGPGPREQFDTWSDYAYLRYEGAPGGPNFVPGLVGSIETNDLTIDFFGHSSVVDKLPPDLGMTNTKIVPFIIAASEEYLILTTQFSREDIRSGKLGDSLQLHVHDRLRDRWDLIQSEGNSPRLRLFGPWLTTIVGNWSEHQGPNPGRDNERSEADKTERLPPVQSLYRSFVGHNISLPGILVLQNLADGRKIRIETGQEDSEILQINGETVLYRINDTIYEAKIDSDQLKGATVVVKDDDVPEIHWAFWSK